MFNTLRAKLAIMLLGLLGLLGAFNAIWLVRTSRFYLHEVNQKLDRDLAKHLAEERVVTASGLIDRTAASETFRTLMLINRNIEIYLLDRDGRILAFSAPPGSVKREAVGVEPIRRFLTGAEFPIFGDDPKNPGGQKVFSATDFPLSRGGQGAPEADGYLYVVLLGQDYSSSFSLLSSSQILRSSAWALGASVAIALVASLFMVRMLTGRLSWLGHEMGAFRSGNFQTLPAGNPSTAAAGDEIDELCVTFQQMARTINEQFERLKESDRLRRELIANVSHDLRTPLQSLQTYLETLLSQERTLHAIDRRRYLEMAVKHCTSLSTLISQLFELAKLESRETQPHLEPFSVCELTQDIAQRFELLAGEHGLHVHLSLERTVPHAVGDIALIERVLINLIENAMQHTPERGSIFLTCLASGAKVVTSVADTGPGIAVADLPHIFDRQYRGFASAGQRADGAGLGLAISQRILELHGSALRVDTTETGGAVFSFELPMMSRTQVAPVTET